MAVKKTAEDACIEYAIAVADVRQLTRVIGDPENQCLRWSKWEANKFVGVAPEPCLTVHWRIDHDRDGREVPEMPYDDMCDSCKLRCDRVRERKIARERLGAAKRVVGAIGKRLIKEYL
jgi:hypothetical protein